LPLPGPLKSGLDALLAPAVLLDEATRVLPQLAAANSSDGATLASFGELWEQFAPRLGEGDEAAAPPSSAAPPADAILGAPAISPISLSSDLLSAESTAALFEELQDPSSRLRQRLPVVGTLSRRFAATLLRRVASRLDEHASHLPVDEASLTYSVAQRTADADRRLATLIEPAAGSPTADEPVASKQPTLA